MSESEWQLFCALVVVCFGLVFGSFLNVLVHRLPRAESIVWPGSRCADCGAAIRWYHNVPVFSWLWLRGRCAGCRSPIATRYLLVELLAAGVLLLVWLRFGASAAFVVFGIYALGLVALFWTDFETFLLPNKLTYPLIALGLLWSPWSPLVTPLSAGAGAVLGYGSLWALATGYRRLRGEEGMGGGDFKLAAAIGAFSGAEGLLQVLLISSFGGSLLGIAMVIIRRGTMKSMLPFGCFLAPAALLIVLFDVSALWSGWQALVGHYLWGYP